MRASSSDTRGRAAPSKTVGTPRRSASGRRSGRPGSAVAAVSGSGPPQGRAELLQWVNDEGSASYGTVTDLKDGLLYAQLLQYYAARVSFHFTECVPKATTQSTTRLNAAQAKEWNTRLDKATEHCSRLKWVATSEEECHHNMLLLQSMLRSCVPKQWSIEVDVHRLSAGKLQDHMVFLQWLNGYSIRIYDRYTVPDERIKEVPTPFHRRETLQEANPTLMLRPELLWTRHAPTACGAQESFPPPTADGYDASRYAVKPRASSSRGRSRPLLRPTEGKPASIEDYLKPIVDHVEMTELSLQRRIKESDDSEQRHRLLQLARSRDSMRRLLGELAVLSYEGERGGSKVAERLVSVFEQYKNVLSA